MLKLFSRDSWLGPVFEGGSNPPIRWKQLVYNICLFHSAMTNRISVVDGVYKLNDADIQVK